MKVEQLITPDLLLPVPGQSVLITQAAKVTTALRARWRGMWIYHVTLDGFSEPVWVREAGAGKWEEITTGDLDALDQKFLQDAGGSNGPLQG